MTVRVLRCCAWAGVDRCTIACRRILATGLRQGDLLHISKDVGLGGGFGLAAIF
jgi:hypothetical protein